MEFSFSRNRTIGIKEYDALHKTFNPSEFDAKEWVKMFKEVGYKIVKYSLLNGGKVNVKQTNREIILEIGKYDFQTPTTIVMLERDGNAEEIKPYGELRHNS